MSRSVHSRSISTPPAAPRVAARRASRLALAGRGGGRIVVVSSTAGHGFDSYAGVPYTASKWAVRGMTKAVAMELAPLGIRVNSIHPGHVHTGLASQRGDDLSFKEAMIEEHTRGADATAADGCAADGGRGDAPRHRTSVAPVCAAGASSRCRRCARVSTGMDDDGLICLACKK